MNQNLTLLQRAVIQQLRTAGYAGIAEDARRSWSANQPVRMTDYPGIMDAIASIAPDFIRANGQAGRG